MQSEIITSLVFDWSETRYNARGGILNGIIYPDLDLYGGDLSLDYLQYDL